MCELAEKALLLVLFVLVFGFRQPGEPLVDLEQRLTLARVHVGDVLLVAQEGILLDDAQLVELAEPTQQDSCEQKGYREVRM